MTQPCADIERLIDKRARGLDEAERLLLEQHLTVCEACRESAGFMHAISQMMRDVPVPELSEPARKRAIASALNQVGRGHNELGSRRLWRPALFAIAAAAVLALLVPTLVDQFGNGAVPLATREQPTSRTPAKAAPAVPAVPATDGGWIDAMTLETRQFAHAEVTLEAGTRVRFDPVSATLELARGRTTVDVDVTRERPFRVLTQSFRVEVLGTRFVVTESSVEVERGRVQVFDLAGQPLARDLRPGGTFSLGSKTKSQAREPHGSARTWLARARDALGRGDAPTARDLIARAEESDPARQDRAEAGTLRAECALIERDPEAAVRWYRSVADRYGDLAAGENAAFAAAQIATRTQGQQGARALFERYLARYPRGRFADEARARIGASK